LKAPLAQRVVGGIGLQRRKGIEKAGDVAADVSRRELVEPESGVNSACTY
jgi:hypothetical protein